MDRPLHKTYTPWCLLFLHPRNGGISFTATSPRALRAVLSRGATHRPRGQISGNLAIAIGSQSLLFQDPRILPVGVSKLFEVTQKLLHCLVGKGEPFLDRYPRFWQLPGVYFYWMRGRRNNIDFSPFLGFFDTWAKVWLRGWLSHFLYKLAIIVQITIAILCLINLHTSAVWASTRGSHSSCPIIIHCPGDLLRTPLEVRSPEVFTFLRAHPSTATLIGPIASNPSRKLKLLTLVNVHLGPFTYKTPEFLNETRFKSVLSLFHRIQIP